MLSNFELEIKKERTTFTDDDIMNIVDASYKDIIKYDGHEWFVHKKNEWVLYDDLKITTKISRDMSYLFMLEHKKIFRNIFEQIGYDIPRDTQLKLRELQNITNKFKNNEYATNIMEKLKKKLIKNNVSYGYSCVIM